MLALSAALRQRSRVLDMPAGDSARTSRMQMSPTMKVVLFARKNAISICKANSRNFLLQSQLMMPLKRNPHPSKYPLVHYFNREVFLFSWAARAACEKKGFGGDRIYRYHTYIRITGTYQNVPNITAVLSQGHS